MIRSTAILCLVILGFILHDWLHIEACVVAMAGASILLLLKNQNMFLEILNGTLYFSL